MHDMSRNDRSWVRPAIGIVLLVAGVGIAWQVGAFDLLSTDNLELLDAWFDSLGWWAPGVFVALWVVAAIFFLPGLPITLVGGLVFGAVWGTVWTTVGANLGATAAFLVGRHLARGLVEKRIASNERLRKIDAGVRRLGWRMVLVTRLVPVFPFNIQNYVYGLTDIRLSTFVLVSLPAMLPATIAYTFAAGSLRTGDLGRALWCLAIAAAFFVLVSALPAWVTSRISGNEVQSQD
jgi:uncharacterized membrane protein YdjX (TVP38/TMEM64 family)